MEWEIQQETRFLNRQASSVFQFPPQYTGDETWWVTADRLVIEGHGVPRSGREGALKTWILLDEGWVFSHDVLTNTLDGIPWRRFDEERRRQARAAMVEAVRLERRARDPEFYRRFLGDLSVEQGAMFDRNVGMLLAAAPGRAWRIRGEGRWGIHHDPMILGLAFEGVTSTRARAVGERLIQLSPRTIEEIRLPRGQSTVVFRRELTSSSPASLEEAMDGFPRAAADEIQRREERWNEFRTLWRFLEDPQSCPPELDARGVRMRLESHVTPAEVPTIRELLHEVPDIQDQEELLLILFAAAPRLFPVWYEESIARRDVARVVALISVLSLRAPEQVVERIERLLKDTPAFWEGVNEKDATKAQTWLEGVRKWIETEARFRQP